VRLLYAIKTAINQELVEPYLTDSTDNGTEIDRASILKSIARLIDDLIISTDGCVLYTAFQIARYIQIYLCYSQVQQWYNSLAVQHKKLLEIQKYSRDCGNGYRCYAQYVAIGGDSSYGRTSATKASLQIIPKPTEANKLFNLAGIKSVFCALLKHLIARYDLNGAHGQIASYMAKESIIDELAKIGIKFHFYTVQGLLKDIYKRHLELSEIKNIKGDKTHLDYDLINKLYALGKEVYYSYLNCASAKSIQNSILNRSGIIIPIKECDGMLKAIKATYRNITKWIDSLKWKAKANTQQFYSASNEAIAAGCSFKLEDGTILRYERQGEGSNSYYQLPVITSSHYQCVEGFALLTFLRKHQLSGSPIEVVHHNHDELVFSFPEGCELEFVAVIKNLESHLRTYIPTYRGDLGDDYIGYISGDGHW
jgi:ABC-type transport system substrate-binding protein